MHIIFHTQLLKYLINLNVQLAQWPAYIIFPNMCFIGKIDKHQLVLPNWWRLDLGEFLQKKNILGAKDTKCKIEVKDMQSKKFK